VRGRFTAEMASERNDWVAAIPQRTLAKEYAGIYAEAKYLYSELSKEKKH